MVLRREKSPTQEDTRGSNDPNAISEMRSAMNELCHQNQIPEDNILNIQKR